VEQRHEGILLSRLALLTGVRPCDLGASDPVRTQRRALVVRPPACLARRRTPVRRAAAAAAATATCWWGRGSQCRSQ
jgi:hypothetical protein